MNPELSIIMPCLNEAETLGACIRKAKEFLWRSGITGEIVIGDNGSTDGSIEIALREGARVINIPVRGYGAALYGAINASRGKYCIMADSDDSYDFTQLDAFVGELREGADLVMGNRFLGGIAPGAMPWKNRHIGNPILSGIGRFLFAAPIRDFHCGIRGFSREAFRRMDLRTTGMEFASEMVIKATLMDMKIIEVPTTLSPDGRSRPPHLRPWRDGWRHLRFMLLFSPNWLFLYPGIALILGGFLLGALLASTPVYLFGARFSVDTLIYCSAMIQIGIQSVLFALMSRAFAIQEQLLPKSQGLEVFSRIFSLERGLIVGIALLAVGCFLLFDAIGIWKAAQFGAVNVEKMARIVAGSSLALSVGFEVILSSLMLSMLRLNVRHFAQASKPNDIAVVKMEA